MTERPDSLAEISIDNERFIGRAVAIDAAFLLADFVAAVLAGSITVWADLVRDAVELLTGLFAWLCLRKIGRRARGRHDYGLGKLENIVSVVFASALVVSAVYFVQAALQRFQSPAPLDPWRVVPALVMAALAALADASLGWRSYRLSKRRFSPVMESSWRLYLQSTLADLVVVATLGLSIGFADESWSRHIDPASSILIVIMMLYAAYGIVSSSVRDLLDGALEESLQILIVRCLADHFDRYTGLHGFRSRRSGSHVFIELFLEFDGNQRMSKVQQSIDAIRLGLESAIPDSTVSIVPTKGGFSVPPAGSN